MRNARFICGLALLLTLGLSQNAFAERGEHVFTTGAGLSLPSFKSTSTAAFALATYSARSSYRYGVLDDLFVGARMTFSSFGAKSEGYTYRDESLGLDYEGTLYFDGMAYHPELTFLYNVYPGYNLAPRIEAALGYLFTTYSNNDLLDGNDNTYGLTIADFGEGAMTASLGVVLDMRIANLMFLGVGARFVQAFGGTYEQSLELPMTLSFYW